MITWKDIISGFVFTAVFFGVTTGLSLAVQYEESIPFEIHIIDFKDRLLSVSVANQKFKHVIEVVAQKAGIDIFIPESIDEYITVTFYKLPLEEGLKKLLKGRNHVFVYSRPDEASGSPILSKILIFPNPKSEDSITAKSNFNIDEVAEIKENPSKQKFNDDSIKLFIERSIIHNSIEEFRSPQPSREANQQISELLNPNFRETELKQKVYDALLRMEGIHKKITKDFEQYKNDIRAK